MNNNKFWLYITHGLFCPGLACPGLSRTDFRTKFFVAFILKSVGDKSGQTIRNLAQVQILTHLKKLKSLQFNPLSRCSFFDIFKLGQYLPLCRNFNWLIFFNKIKLVIKIEYFLILITFIITFMNNLISYNYNFIFAWSNYLFK